MFHMCSKTWHLPLCSSPAGVSPAICPICHRGFGGLGCHMGHVSTATAPGTCWCPESKWPCLLFLVLPVPCCGTWRAGYLSCPQHVGTPLSRHSRAPGSGVRPSSQCSSPSCSPCRVAIQFKGSQACLILELAGALGKRSVFGMCLEVLT